MSVFHPDLKWKGRLIPPISIGPRLAKRINYRLRSQGVPPPPTVEGVIIEDHQIPTFDAQTIRVRVFTPTDQAKTTGALLWVHGGGFVLGVPEQNARQSIEICKTVGIVVVSVDYRLAPDHPFPTPFEDCYSALLWMYANAQSLGIDRAKIAVGGASAGGNLAAATTNAAIDRGIVTPAFQLLLCPMLDDRDAFQKDGRMRGVRMWTKKANIFGWRSYLGTEPGSSGVDEYAAPARRKDLTDIPPTWIGAGIVDILYNESVDYARRLKDAGINCEFVSVPGAFHGFDTAAPDAPVVRDFQAIFMKALKRALA